MQLVKSIFGLAVFKLYNCAVITFYICIAAWHVGLFFYPPCGSTLIAAALVFACNTLAFVGLSGSEISMENPDWKLLRLRRIITVGGTWLEFGTDFSSGVTAVKQGYVPVGASILVVGAHSSDVAVCSHLEGPTVTSSLVKAV